MTPDKWRFPVTRGFPELHSWLQLSYHFLLSRNARKPALVSPSEAVPSVANAEIVAVRVLQNQRTYTRFRIHHHSFRKLYADLFRAQQLPQACLVIEVRACRIARSE